ncbi:MAG TPA: 3-deoxy-8-phosphooctulonate synthase [Bacteroidales bacterium]|jgi:2-dehydro-3-deoxyphosphooctonate aldolase (KDO 8-P synthase)|nr:3-deoxy-8-phosphooctulonate synthase [Bacteroidales bacterium]HOS73140.1 3-deoxy-8-phosphooctulonate synthase [Bacteroidales bacterium]HQH23646.1 3-deoxy-8-phosphooctulonate synthase [Bacteroidales bacterium]HQJ81168.1 3-deoxy-8-phosphooctulonate synthase [Bacteroidales bacterium]
MKTIIPKIPDLKHADNEKSFLLIAGPCVVESEDLLDTVAGHLAGLSDKYKIPLILKASYRKANRSRGDSFQGIGDIKALGILKRISSKYSVPAVTDIHNPDEAEIAAGYVDVLQIPAFLCRQTDLLEAAARTGKWLNIKKGQFLSGSAMKFAVTKVHNAGNRNVMLTERGTTFGYQDLVVDFRNIAEMKENKVPVIVDITHSLQQPNQPSGVSGGNPGMIEIIGRAAIAAGADGIFIETHPDPASARSDGENMLKLDKMEYILKQLIAIKNAINSL